jgi:hypothetical protein
MVSRKVRQKENVTPIPKRSKFSAASLEDNKQTFNQIVIMSSSKNPAVVIFDQPNLDIPIHDLVRRTERLTETHILDLEKAIFVESSYSDLSLQDIRNIFYNISKDAESGAMSLGSQIGVVRKPRYDLSLKQLFEAGEIKSVGRTMTRTKTVIVIIITEDVIIIIIIKRREVSSQER